MIKFKKTFLIGSILFVAGSVLAIVGAANKGADFKGVNYENGKFVVHKQATRSYDLNLNQPIEADTGVGLVQVEQGDENKIIVEGNSKDLPKIENKSGKTTIKSPEAKHGLVTITIQVKSKETLKSLHMTKSEGMFDISDVKIDDLKIDNANESNDGNDAVVIDSSTIKHLAITNKNNAEVSITSSTLEDGRVVTESGNVDIENTTIKNNLAVTTQDGDVDIEGVKAKDWDTKSDHGDIERGGDLADKSANAKISVKTTDGDISVQRRSDYDDEEDDN